ncbi:MAG: glutathione S-transferase C-terminal domain-containing protein [Actinomycetota bacterium]|nr:glutathione S-transferase C-terminal domain-containing protein [Actinomycetota bacterium]
MKAFELPDEEMTRDPMAFTDRVTASSTWPTEPGRYRLVISRACPWANRTAIVRRLMGLDAVISQAVTDPVHEIIADDSHWVFTDSPGGKDPVLGIHSVREAYLARDSAYTGGVSVPALVDVPTGQLVSNDFDQLTIDLGTEWGAYQRPGAPVLYPQRRRDEIDAINTAVYHEVNNGVYLAGFAPNQAAYDRAVTTLFARLDALEEHLTTRRFLVGDTITEADVRLWPTLVRFDAVYHGHFKCNVRKLVEYPALWAYARDLFQTPGFGDTVDFDQVRRHYYYVHSAINPSRIVAAGPNPASWLTAHHREELGGRPFGDGTPPGPPLPVDQVPTTGKPV